MSWEQNDSCGTTILLVKMMRSTVFRRLDGILGRLKLSLTVTCFGDPGRAASQLGLKKHLDRNHISSHDYSMIYGVDPHGLTTAPEPERSERLCVLC